MGLARGHTASRSTTDGGSPMRRMGVGGGQGVVLPRGPPPSRSTTDGGSPMRRRGMAGVVLGAAFLTMVSSAWAEPATHCVKATKVGKKHTGGWTNASCTAVSPTHEGKYEK